MSNGASNASDRDEVRNNLSRVGAAGRISVAALVTISSILGGIGAAAGVWYAHTNMLDQDRTTSLTAEVAANTRAIYETGLERLVQERELLELLRSRAETEQRSTRQFDQLLAEKERQILAKERRLAELEARRNGIVATPPLSQSKTGHKTPQERGMEPDDVRDASGLTPRERRAIFETQRY